MTEKSRTMGWLIGPHPRLTDVEERLGARLFASLMLAHFCLVLFAILGINFFYLDKVGRSIWNSEDAIVTLGGLSTIALSYALLRFGAYRLSVLLYIADTAAAALWAPFVGDPNAEIGLLASAIIPVLLSALVFSYRWVIAILISVLAVGTVLVSWAPLEIQISATGYALLIVVAAAGGLVIAFRRHLDSLERERHSQIRKVAVKYRNLFDSVVDGIFIVDNCGRVVEANQGACQQLLRTRDELIGAPLSDISARADFNLESLIPLLKGAGNRSFRTAHKRKDGTEFPVELSLTLLEHQGEANILGVARDITRQQSELAFREAVISKAAEGMCVCHEIGEYPYVAFSLWNDRMTEITGYTMEEINRLGWYQSVYPDPEIQAKAVARMAEMRNGNDLTSEEWIITRNDGRERIVEISTSRLRTSDHGEHVLGLILDVTERKQIEQEFSRSEKKYRELFDSVLEGIGLVDRNELIVFANPALARIFEVDSVQEIVGKSIMDFVTPGSRETLLSQTAMRAQGQISQYEHSITSAKGREKWIYLSVTPQFFADGAYSGALGAVVDITERKASERLQAETQQKLERAERMESLGLLAGGVAHDLNNMLGPVAGYAELLLRESSLDPKIAGRVQKIAKSAHDAANVIQDLLTLARRGRYQMTPICLNEVIRGFLESPGFEEFRQRHINIRLEVDLSTNLGQIDGSSSHLAKVIMNLVSNAFEAMPAGGVVAIRTEERELSTLIGGHSCISPGSYVLVRVKDSGVGIPVEDMNKIFEPYFSKKRMGHSGSGLGLSVVYGVVKDHHGHYDVFSEPGKGTEFVLYFPMCTATAAACPAGVATVRGAGRVLVVDDVPDQRELSREVLMSIGYSVEAVEHGRAAIEYLQKQSVDVVLLDMIMEPNFDGLETYRAILELYPGQPCVVVSGYAETERVQETLRLGAGPYVRKPFSIDTIGNAVQDALSRKASPVPH